MTLSIIIPTLNEAEHIGALIDFLWEHGDNNIREIIVADGGSTDDTCALAEARNAIVIHCNKGRAVQMNAGARIAQAPVLYFIHADTRPPANFVSHIGMALNQRHTMGCFRYRFDRPNLFMRINAWFTRFYFMFCQGGDKTFYIDKMVFDQLGGYDERYVIMEEYDFLERAINAGFSFYIMPANGIVSARKYQGRSWLQVQMANLVIFNAWRWKLAQPETLKTLYSKLLR